MIHRVYGRDLHKRGWKHQYEQGRWRYFVELYEARKFVKCIHKTEKHSSKTMQFRL